MNNNFQTVFSPVTIHFRLPTLNPPISTETTASLLQTRKYAGYIKHWKNNNAVFNTVTVSKFAMNPTFYYCYIIMIIIIIRAWYAKNTMIVEVYYERMSYQEMTQEADYGVSTLVG